MHRASPLQTSAVTRFWVIVCVVIALALGSWTSTLTSILGTRHVHQTSSAAVLPRAGVALAFLAELRGVFKAPIKSFFVHAAPKQPEHAHDETQRHFHDAADDSVVLLDPVSTLDAARAELNASAAKAAASVLQPLGLARQQALVPAQTAHSPWCETPLWSPKTAELPSRRRPPKHAA